jgi:hypothetical protein
MMLQGSIVPKIHLPSHLSTVGKNRWKERALSVIKVSAAGRYPLAGMAVADRPGGRTEK